VKREEANSEVQSDIEHLLKSSPECNLEGVHQGGSTRGRVAQGDSTEAHRDKIAVY
tara:strand:- start:1018 stop:1185 length:168 start_codon:yes stop_codon:yes gene_type:complete